MNGRTGASSNPPYSRLSSRRTTLVGAVALVTLVTFGLAWYGRQLSGLSPLAPADLTAFEFDSYQVGTAVQELVVPVALIYLFSNTVHFHRIVSGKATRRDRLMFFAVLTAIQLVSLNHSVFVTGELVTFGVLVVAAGGLLGGWRMGLGLGLVTMLIRGTQELVLYPDERFLLLYQTEGLRGFFDLVLLSDVFLWDYLANLDVSSVVWAGFVSGICTDLMGERRFAPVTAFGLGIGFNLGVGYLAATAWNDPAVLVSFLVPSALVAGLALMAIALMVHGVRTQATRRKAEAAELARAQAEMRALRAQINPHFFFNTLNTIRYFVRTDPETARNLLLNLSQVFQRVLRSGEFVPLQDEISYVRAYLALEQSRLDERLKVEWSIQQTNQPNLLDRPVPTLILQPMVENAIVHGIAKKPGGGTVNITVRQAGDDMVLQVEDDGPGIEPARLARILDPAGDAAAVGLRNVDGRLRALYGEDYRLWIESDAGRGTRVQMRIPIEDK